MCWYVFFVKETEPRGETTLERGKGKVTCTCQGVCSCVLSKIAFSYKNLHQWIVYVTLTFL